jgi:hypothetical protein
MFAPRTSVFFRSRRRAQAQVVATVGLAAASAAVAAAAVYFFDARSGKRRREVLRDQMARAGRESCDMAARIGRGTYKRATGMYRRSKRHLHSVAESAPF